MLELYFIFKFYPNFFVITTPTLISATNQRQRLTMLLHLVGQLIGKRMLDEKRLFTQCGRNISRAKVLRRECFTKPTASSNPQLQTRNIQPQMQRLELFSPVTLTYSDNNAPQNPLLPQCLNYKQEQFLRCID